MQVDLLDLQQPNGAVASVLGETWYLEASHRESSPAGATSNFTAVAGFLLQWALRQLDYGAELSRRHGCGERRDGEERGAHASAGAV